MEQERLRNKRGNRTREITEQERLRNKRDYATVR